MSIVHLEHLFVDYGRLHPVHAVRDVSLTIADNEFVGLVGESGCGKSTLGFAIARLERPPARITAGTIAVAGQDWTTADARTLRPERWTKVAMVLQSGMNALNPIMSIEAQFRDVMMQHGEMTVEQCRRRAAEVLEMVEIPSTVLPRYPHELSGGMKQRVAIALAIVLRPKLIIMDEPTTALDMVVQRQILENLKQLRREQAFALLFISHDLGLELELVDRVLVMYAGEIVESQPARTMLDHPFHPYTRALLRALPDPETPYAEPEGIPGMPPDLHEIPQACLFAPRCPLAEPECLEAAPPLKSFSELTLRCRVTEREVQHVS